ASAVFALIAISIVFLAIALAVPYFGGRALNLEPADQITAMLAGSQKSLASGVPMAQVLFATSAVGMMVLPLMVYHQIQLMVCAVLAQHWGRRHAPAGESELSAQTGH